MHAAIGQDVLAPLAARRALGREAHQREVGGTAADVDDEYQLFLVDARLVIEGGRNRFELEGDVLETDIARDLFERILGQLVGGRILIDEVHRTAQHHLGERAPGGAFGALLEFTDELRKQATIGQRTAAHFRLAIDGAGTEQALQ